jgi:hypothetical protein
MPSIVVIDKDVFQGSSVETLRDSARRHTLVISYVLCVECLGHACHGRVDLLDRIQRIVSAGAYCGAQPLKLAEKERVSLSPIDSIIDRDATEVIRNGSAPHDPEYLAAEADKYRRSLEPIVVRMLELGETFYGNVVAKGYLAGMRAADMEDKGTRLRLWVEATDKMSKELMEKTAADMASYLTPEWYTWQSHRLRWVLGFEWAYQTAKSGNPPTLLRASHDFHDMQYVAYLTKADSLVTRDEALVAPLARAAFPEKDICADVADVT